MIDIILPVPNDAPTALPHIRPARESAFPRQPMVREITPKGGNFTFDFLYQYEYFHRKLTLGEANRITPAVSLPTVMRATEQEHRSFDARLVR